MTFATGMLEALETYARLGDTPEGAAFWADTAPKVPTLDIAYPGAGGQAQALRFYRGTLPAPAPVILYIHGGGWIGGSIALNDYAVRTMVASTGYSAVSISYRLAPANPFPAGIDDVSAAVQWLRSSAPALGLDPDFIVLSGASAGANLALAESISRPSQAISGLVLFYGLYGDDLTTESHRVNGQKPGLSSDDVTRVLGLYDPSQENRQNPRMLPLAAQSFKGQPPSLIILAEHDCLADDSRLLAQRMTQDGVNAALVEVEGVTHGFINRGRLVPAANETLAKVSDFLRSLRS